MTPTEPALRLLRRGIQVGWPAPSDPKQPWLTQGPLWRTVTEVKTRQIVFHDGTRLDLPAVAQLRVGKTADGKADTITLLCPPNPPVILTVHTPPNLVPVSSWADLRNRCQKGVWIEVLQDTRSSQMAGRRLWAIGTDFSSDHLAIKFSNQTWLLLTKHNERDLQFKDGNVVVWQTTERRSWISVPMTYYGRIRVRPDLLPPIATTFALGRG